MVTTEFNVAACQGGPISSSGVVAMPGSVGGVPFVMAKMGKRKSTSGVQHVPAANSWQPSDKLSPCYRLGTSRSCITYTPVYIRQQTDKPDTSPLERLDLSSLSTWHRPSGAIPR